MALNIQVNPDAVQSLVEKARQVPGERMDSAIDKLTSLREATSDWKGDAPADHETAVQELEKVLTNTKTLMDAILAAMDQAVDQFEQKDDEISSKFEMMVDSYTSDK